MKQERLKEEERKAMQVEREKAAEQALEQQAMEALREQQQAQMKLVEALQQQKQVLQKKGQDTSAIDKQVKAIQNVWNSLNQASNSPMYVLYVHYMCIEWIVLYWVMMG